MITLEGIDTSGYAQDKHFMELGSMYAMRLVTAMINHIRGSRAYVISPMALCRCV